MNGKKAFAGMFILFFLIGLSGCSTDRKDLLQESVPENVEKETAETEVEEAFSIASEAAAELYRDIYEKAAFQGKLDSPETINAIVKRLEKHGCAASDTENQNRFDMGGWEQADRFCREAEAGESAKISIFSILGDGGFVRFDLAAEGGAMEVTRSVLGWLDGVPTVRYQSTYPAYQWIYTEDGYLFFDEYTPEGYDGAPAYTALRVLPLEEECRRLNQEYLLPIGYGANNMFLVDWSEEDFGALNFSDLYPILYPTVMQKRFPYSTDSEGGRFRVPAEDVEKVILSRFAADPDVLRGQMDFDEKSQCYLYTARSFYDAGISLNQPYPEVVSYRKNADSTLTLTVHAVLPKQHLSRAFIHEVTIRQTDNGFQYVSNRILSADESVELFWYSKKDCG